MPPTPPDTSQQIDQHKVASTDLLVASTQDHLLSLPDLESKDHEIFRWEVKDFFDTQKELLQAAIDKGHPNPALQTRVELMKRFVNEAEFRELGQLCNLLALFPIFAAAQHRHEELFMQVRSSHHSIDPADKLTMAAKRKEMFKIRESLIGFNHLLRDFLVENGDYIDRNELENWFAKMNHNAAGPGKVIIGGVAAEAAVIRFVQRQGDQYDLRVRPSTIDEDKKGIDIVVNKGGRVKQVDIKTGGQISFGVTGNEEINVEGKQIINFDLDANGQRDVLAQLLAM